jgi:hypothetical protein
MVSPPRDAPDLCPLSLALSGLGKLPVIRHNCPTACCRVISDKYLIQGTTFG